MIFKNIYLPVCFINPGDLAGNIKMSGITWLYCAYMYISQDLKSLKFQDLFHVMRMNLTKSDVSKGSLFGHLNVILVVL